MKIFRIVLPMSLTFGLVMTLPLYMPALAQAATPDPIDLDPGLQAQVAKEKLKQNRANAGTDKTKVDKSQCGKIDIGNDNSNKKATDRIAPKEKTIIVTGNIINAARC